MSRDRRRRRLASALALAVAVAALAVLAAVAGASEPTLQVWLTTADGTNALTEQSGITLGPVSRGSVNVAVNDSRTYQTITGFGAAFTDSSTYLMENLKGSNSSGYSTMMNDLFSTSNGIGLSFWRIPMTSSDFNSTSSPWTDDDTQGPSGNLTEYFGLTAQDTGHIIPVIQDALAINPNLTLLASPWSPPAWMKSNDSMICSAGSGDGTLNSSDDQAWADYFVKWIKAYEADGIPIWGVTPQNEPLYCATDYPSSSWDPTSEANWVQNYLVPDLSANDLSPSIIGYDHNMDELYFPQDLNTSSAASDFSGMAWHCYNNDSEPAEMSAVHNQYGGNMYETECSSDTTPTDIIPYTTTSAALLSIQNWAKGFIMWNVALNPDNGPHLGGCTSCVPLVTINGSSYSLDNNYYQLGQLSKFVAVGATHIGSTVNAHGIVTAAFKNPNGQEVLVATNPTSSSITFNTTWNGQGSFSYTLPSEATVTFVGTVPAAPSMPTTPVAGQTYNIVNSLSGKPFGVYGASTENGGSIVQWTDDDDPDQQWTLVSAGGGYYYVENVNSGLVLDDTGGSTSNGTDMQQWALDPGDYNQEWQINSVGSGRYTFTNRTSGLDLDLTGAGLSDGTDIQQWSGYSGDMNQEWLLHGVPRAATPATPTAGRSYRIINDTSGKPFGVAGGSTANGAGIVGSAEDGTLDQVWTLVSAGGGYYNLINANSGAALDDTGGSTSNGTDMQQWVITGTGDSNQQWEIVSVGSGYYNIVNATSGKVLDLTGGDTDDGTAIQQWSTSSGDTNQSWEFVPSQ